jgi:AsmA protein
VRKSAARDDIHMNKVLKWSGIALLAVLGVVGLTLAYLIATFDPNDYRSHLVQAVHDRTGRTLKLDGDIALSFFPVLGARLGPASLTEPRSEREFASLESARLAMKLMPLLRGEAVVDAIEVKGLRAVVERDRQGRYNFEDLTGAAEAAPERPSEAPVKVDIARIVLSDADLTYVDRGSGARYRLTQLDLKTGRIASGVTTPLEISTNLFSDAHKAKLASRLKARLTFDAARELYRLEGLDFSAKGAWGSYSGLEALARGLLEVRPAAGELVTEGLALSLKASATGGELTARLEAPKLMLTEQRVEGAAVILQVNRSAGQDRLAARITIPAVKGAYKAFNAGPLEGDVEMRSAARTIKARLAGTLAGNLEAKRLSLERLALNATIADPTLPDGTLQAALTGSARADLAKETAALDFDGTIDRSKVNGKAGITRLAPLAVTFDVQADRLDLDRLLGQPATKAGGKTPAKGTAGSPADRPFDLSFLRGYDATGSLRVGELRVHNLTGSQVRANARLTGGRLEVNPLTAQLYQGSLSGLVAVEAADPPAFTVRQNLSGVAVGPLLRDAAQIDTLQGRGTVSANLTSRGATVDALKRALNGTLAVSLADGSLKGVDIAGTVRSVRTRLKELRGQQVQQSDMTQQTDFSELKASFQVRNGVARNDDLSMKSPLLRASGAGEIDIGNDRLNYTLKATVVATTQGQGGRELAELRGLTVPVQLTGALAAPQYTIDFAGMVTDLAAERLQDELARRAAGAMGGKAPAAGKAEETVRDLVKDRLKGIFGR